jgi:hypothetical protein
MNLKIFASWKIGREKAPKSLSSSSKSMYNFTTRQSRERKRRHNAMDTTTQTKKKKAKQDEMRVRLHPALWRRMEAYAKPRAMKEGDVVRIAVAEYLARQLGEAAPDDRAA